MNKIITTNNLQVNDLPSKNSAWKRIIEFASTFDIKSECAEGIRVSGVKDIGESSSLIEIRAALYSEWRRYNHLCSSPEKEILSKVWEVIEILRIKLTIVN